MKIEVQEYRSSGRGVNKDNDMVRIVVDVSKRLSRPLIKTLKAYQETYTEKESKNENCEPISRNYFLPS